MKRLAILAVCVMLSGCETWGIAKPTVTFKPIEIPKIDPTPMALKPVQWQVYTVDELKAMVAAAEARGETNTVFYVLSRDDYDALAYNITEMKRFIQDQKSTTEYLVEAIRINNEANAPKKKPE